MAVAANIDLDRDPSSQPKEDRPAPAAIADEDKAGPGIPEAAAQLEISGDALNVILLAAAAAPSAPSGSGSQPGSNPAVLADWTARIAELGALALQIRAPAADAPANHGDPEAPLAAQPPVVDGTQPQPDHAGAEHPDSPRLLAQLDRPVDRAFAELDADADLPAPVAAADIDTAAGGDLDAEGPIIVSAPVAAFDLKPEASPLAEAAFGSYGRANSADPDLRSHLADLLWGSAGSFEESSWSPAAASAEEEAYDPTLLRAWDPGRSWKSLGNAIEPLGNVELDWFSYRRIASRDGPMAQLTPSNMTVAKIEEFLGLQAGELDSLDPASRPTGGSAMRSVDAIHLEAGQTIWFDVFFDPPSNAASHDPTQQINDFALITISVNGETSATLFADSIGVGKEGATGWQSLKYTAGVSGDYYFGFAVINDDDSGGMSRLYVDSVRNQDISGFSYTELAHSSDELGGSLQVLAAAPVAVQDVVDGLADRLTSVDVLANDIDPDPFNALQLIAVDNTGTRGSVRLASGQPLSYDPGGKFAYLAAGQVATDTFHYIVDGGNGIRSTGTVTVRVIGVNDAPTAAPDWAAAVEDGSAVVVNALANDDDIDLDDTSASLRLASVQSSAGASTAFSGAAGAGFYYFAGSAFDFLGAGETYVDQVTYTVIDRYGASAVGAVYVTVVGSNDRPIASGDVAYGGEDAAFAIDPLSNDRDPDLSDRLSVISVSGVAVTGQPVTLASGATVSLAADGRLLYDPAARFDYLAPGQTASDGFLYRVSDGHGGSAEAWVGVTIRGQNDAPRPTVDFVVTDEDDHGHVVATGLLLVNDRDRDVGDALTILGVDGPGVSFAGSTFSYDPGTRFQYLGLGQTATERLGYTVIDHYGATAHGEIVVTIEGRNDAPVAQADNLGTIEENQPVALNLVGNDADPDVGDSLGVIAIDGQAIAFGGSVTLASGARVTLQLDGALVYDPAGAFTHLGFQQTSIEHFSYRISDRYGATAEASVQVSVKGVNDAPVAHDDVGGTTSENGTAFASLLANDRDPDDNDYFEVVAIDGKAVRVGNPLDLDSGARVLLQPGGILVYQPNGRFDYLAPGEIAIDEITYTIRDQLGETSTAVARFTVIGETDHPVAIADNGYGIDEDNVLTFDAANGVLANDYDPDRGDSRRLFVSKVNGSTANVGTAILLASGAKLILNADGSFSYDPQQGYDGLSAFETRTETFTYTVSDGSGGESTATASINVVGRNDPPVAAADRGVTHADASVRLHVIENDTDAEWAGLRVIGVDAAHQDVVRINADGTLTYDPTLRFATLKAGETATDTFYYTIDDGLGGRATAGVTMTIHGTGTVPTAGRSESLESFEVPAGQGLLVDGWGREPGNGVEPSAVTLFSGSLPGFESFRPTDLDSAVQLRAAGSSAHGQSAIERYLGLPGNALPADDGRHAHQTGDGSDAGAASAIKTSVRFTAADLSADGRLTLSFDWNFLSAEAISANRPGANDYAVVTIASAETGVAKVLVLSDARETGLGASGWRTSTYDLMADFRAEILAGRELIIGFAVINDDDDLRPSSLLLDNIRLNATVADAELLRSDDSGSFQTYRHLPTAVDDQSPTLATDEETRTSFDPAELLANDHASPGSDAPRLVSVDSAYAQAAVFFDGSRIVYDPRGRLDALAEGEIGIDHFDYRITDANGGTATGQASVIVHGLNDAPQARLDTFATLEDAGIVAIHALANDDDVDSDDDASSLRIIGAEAASGATVHFDPAAGGALYYDVASCPSFQSLGAGETATDIISYRVADRWYSQPGHSAETTTATGQVVVTIVGINDLPTASADTAITDEKTAVVLDVLSNDSDPDRSDRLQVTRINGQVLTLGNPVILASGAVVGLMADGRLHYDPANGFDHLRPGQAVTDSFTYTAADGSGGSADATVAVIVAGLNDAPVARPDAVTVDEDHALSFSASALLRNDFDADHGDSMAVISVQGHGISFDGTNVTYDPGARFQSLGFGETAIDRVLYTIRDQAGATSQAEIALTIEGRNDAPIAVNDTGSVREDHVLTLSLTKNDLDPDSSDQGHLFVSALDTSGTVGVAYINADGTVSYDPVGRFDYLRAGEVAYDHFDYVVSDGHGGTDRGTMTVAISGRNNLEQIVASFEAPLNWGPAPYGDAERSNTLVQATGWYQELDGQRLLALPTDGTSMIRLEARGTLTAGLEQFLGLGSGSLSAQFTDIDGTKPHAGSALKFQITVQAGDEVSFDWFFDARDSALNPADGNHDNDFAVLTVTDASGTHVYRLSDVRQVGDGGASGWRSSVYTAPDSGTLTIGVATVNDRTTEIGDLAGTQNSALLMDNVRLNRDFHESYQLVQSDPDGHLVTYGHA